jgi:hypothetical protein
MEPIFTKTAAIVAGLAIFVLFFLSGWGKGLKGAIISTLIIIAAAVLLAALRNFGP